METAEAQKKANAIAAREARALVVSGFGALLKEKGYDLDVKANSDYEIIITSSEFSDTDHRVRFLSFIRSKNSPAYGVCGNGFSKIRLRSSSIPFVGFDESYSLDCLSW
jgi:hypothetical protein